MYRLLASFILLLSAFYSVGQDKPGTLLWAVSKVGVSDTSYLFGTFHEVDPYFFLSLSSSVKKLEQVDVLFVEQTAINTDVSSSEEVKLNYWTVEQWDNLLDKEQKQIFESFVEKSESPEYYESPPLLLTLNLTQIYTRFFCDDNGRKSYETMDSFIEKTALNKKREVRSLDENQTNILLRSSLGSTSEEDSAYAVACVELMTKMLNSDLSGCEFVEDYKELNIDYQLERKEHEHPFELTERNDRWMTVLDEVFKENSCFVAVGFRHLQYKQGLVQQLRELGYSVEPIAAR
ncbi:TraB/GumN family protein [Tunicatimonas pelagia]|uniref:TraB/GumN family protein n=1 Tax=Tunicatimonas pelagia TaxID=931531 RepID=UPI0026656087|nr:TraB/GumN family protein [Tunicatimonas pelagia]WKN41218.1 TraB/GumN family protein [Tunicatimonas pelagia]